MVVQIKPGVQRWRGWAARRGVGVVAGKEHAFGGQGVEIGASLDQGWPRRKGNFAAATGRPVMKITFSAASPQALKPMMSGVSRSSSPADLGCARPASASSGARSAAGRAGD